jgi:hypothetical protein
VLLSAHFNGKREEIRQCWCNSLAALATIPIHLGLLLCSTLERAQNRVASVNSSSISKKKTRLLENFQGPFKNLF